MKIQSTSWLGLYLGNLLRPSLSLIHTYLEKASASEFFPPAQTRSKLFAGNPDHRGVQPQGETHELGLCKIALSGCHDVPHGSVGSNCKAPSFDQSPCVSGMPAVRDLSGIFLQLSYRFCFQPRPSNDRTLLFRKY